MGPFKLLTFCRTAKALRLEHKVRFLQLRKKMGFAKSGRIFQELFSTVFSRILNFFILLHILHMFIACSYSHLQVSKWTSVLLLLRNIRSTTGEYSVPSSVSSFSKKSLTLSLAQNSSPVALHQWPFSHCRSGDTKSKVPEVGTFQMFFRLLTPSTLEDWKSQMECERSAVSERCNSYISTKREQGVSFRGQVTPCLLFHNDWSPTTAFDPWLCTVGDLKEMNGSLRLKSHCRAHRRALHLQAEKSDRSNSGSPTIKPS